jgi:asparagine synthase (glutamine-hydrolysing)
MASPKYAGILEYGPTWSGAYLLRRGLFMPWELPELLDADVVREGWPRLQTLARLEECAAGQCSDRARVSALEMSWYMRNQLLRDTDWASMAHSLEVRVPFLDVELLRAASSRLRNGHPPGKGDLAASAGSRLPASVSERRKTGFLTPVGDWIRESIAGKRFAGRGMRGWARYVYERQWEKGSLPLGRKAA